jgi:CO/xanthine dehydrogenase Mo-binding subunit
MERGFRRRQVGVPGVLAVTTGETLAQFKLHWMPTLMSDTQMVLPTEKVMYQAQEALRIKTVADHGYADAAANPSKFPAGLFSICTGSYDVKHAFAEVDRGTGGVKIRRFVSVDDCGNIINPMIVQGQIHGGLTMGPRGWASRPRSGPRPPSSTRWWTRSRTWA